MLKVTKRFSFGYVNGHQIKKQWTVKAATEAEIEEKFAEKVRAFRAVTFRTKGEMTLSDVITAYYDDIIVKPKTRYGDQWYIDVISKRFGSRLIQTIEGRELKEFLDDIKNHPYSKDVWDRFKRTLNKYFTFAADQELLDRNPMNKLKRVHYGIASEEITPGETHVEGEERIRDICKVIRHIMSHPNSRRYSPKLKVQVILSLDCCLRPAELYALTWDKINGKDGTIMIDRNVTTIPKKAAKELNLPNYSKGTTKTKGSTRKLPLSQLSLSALAAYYKDCIQFCKDKNCHNPEKYLFFQRQNIKPGKNVKPAYGSDFDQKITDISKELGIIPNVTPYDMRRLGFTLRITSIKMDPRACDYVMGHVKSKIDARYIISGYQMAKEAQPLWEEILSDIFANKKYQINETPEEYSVCKHSPSRSLLLRKLLHETQNKTPFKTA